MMSNKGQGSALPASTKSRMSRMLALLIAGALCTLCMQPLLGCSKKTGDEGVIEQAIKYATVRTQLDAADSSVVKQLPDAEVEVTLLSFTEAPDGTKEIRVEPSVVSDTMAAWSADEWGKNRDDLFFNVSTHFNLICKQANIYGDVPEGYTVTCPDYLVVYDSQRNVGFVVSSTGVYQKTDDAENPAGEVIALAAKD